VVTSDTFYFLYLVDIPF